MDGFARWMDQQAKQKGVPRNVGAVPAVSSDSPSWPVMAAWTSKDVKHAVISSLP